MRRGGQGGAEALLYRARASPRQRGAHEGLTGSEAKSGGFGAGDGKDKAETGAGLTRDLNGGGILGYAAGFGRVWKAPSQALMAEENWRQRRKKGR